MIGELTCKRRFRVSGFSEDDSILIANTFHPYTRLPRRSRRLAKAGHSPLDTRHSTPETHDA